jgi:hypothetical protein
MTDDTPLPFDLPSVRRKKVTVDFAGGNQSSNGDVLLLREAERKHGVCLRLAEVMPDRRDPDRIRHAVFEMVMSRVLAIACGQCLAQAVDAHRSRRTDRRRACACPAGKNARRGAMQPSAAAIRLSLQPSPNSDTSTFSKMPAFVSSWAERLPLRINSSSWARSSAHVLLDGNLFPEHESSLSLPCSDRVRKCRHFQMTGATSRRNCCSRGLGGVAARRARGRRCR